MKHFFSLCIGLLLCLAPVVSTLAQNAPSPETALVQPATRTVTLTGFTRAKRVMTVTSEVSARCTEVFADRGDGVPPSGILAQLDTTFVDLDLRQIRIRMDQAASRIGYLKTETGRSRELVKRNTQARTHLDRLEQDLEQATLALDELRVQQARLGENKRRHTLRGPGGWTVITRTMEPGEWIAASTPVATLGDFRTLRIPLALGPQERAALEKLPAPTITLSERSLSLAASIFRIAPDFDPQTRKTKVELTITPPPDLRRGGLRCELTLQVPEPETTVLVPATALFERYETHWVTTGDGSDIPVILLGTAENGLVRVSSDALAPGDSIRIRP